MILRGKWATRRIWINGSELYPQKSQGIINHSPDGWNYGYGGSGPSQLALGILLEFTDIETAKKLYQTFKSRYIATLPQRDFEVEMDIDKIISDLKLEIIGEKELESSSSFEVSARS